LANNNYQVISVDGFFNSSPKAYEQVQQITGKQFKTYTIDLCNEKEFDKIFTENKIDGVIHFAAFKAVGESVEQPLKYYHNNIASLVNLLTLCEKHKVNNVIFSSSCSVYGNVQTLPVDENTVIPKAESPYAYTKQVGEEIIKDYTRAFPKLNCIALRYFNPVGAHLSGLIGEDPINPSTNLVPVITETAIGKRKSMNVFGNDYLTRDGSCIRDYIHVTDIANAHIKAMEYIIDKKQKTNYSVFNLGTGNGVSVFEAIAAFEKVSKQKLNYSIVPKREGDVSAIYSDTTLSEQLLQWKPEFTLEQMMESAWKWQLQQQKEGC